MTIVGVAAVLGAAGLLYWFVRLAQSDRLSEKQLHALAAICGIGLVVMLLTDWPSSTLNEFWASHSVLSAVLSTLLLAGIAFMAFEAVDKRTQGRLDAGVTAAGMGAVVDYMIDVEAALALAFASEEPSETDWPGWSSAGPPLRWLRQHRENFVSHRPDNSGDPRRWEIPRPSDLHDPAASWRRQLVSQCVRRVVAGLRDWAPVLSRSRAGQEVLVDFNELRLDLLDTHDALARGDAKLALECAGQLRAGCRVLALALEHGSGARRVRPEVLQSINPLSHAVDPVRTKASAIRRDEKLVPWKERKDLARQQLVSSQDTTL